MASEATREAFWKLNTDSCDALTEQVKWRWFSAGFAAGVADCHKIARDDTLCPTRVHESIALLLPAKEERRDANHRHVFIPTKDGLYGDCACGQRRS